MQEQDSTYEEWLENLDDLHSTVGVMGDIKSPGYSEPEVQGKYNFHKLYSSPERDRLLAESKNVLGHYVMPGGFEWADDPAPTFGMASGVTEGGLPFVSNRVEEREKQPPKGVGEVWRDFSAAEAVPFYAGVHEAAELGSLFVASRDLEKNGAAASPESFKLVNDWLRDQQRERTFLGGTAEILFQLPAFAIEFLTTAAVATGIRKGAAKLAGASIRELLERKLGQNVASRGLATVASGAAQTSMMTSAMTPRVAASAYRRALPGMASMEDGERAAVLFDETSKSFMEALPAGYMDMWIEVLSEKSGEAMGPALKKLPLVNRLNIMQGSVYSRWKKMNPTKTTRSFLDEIAGEAGWGKRLNALGIQGPVTEMLEERVGDVMRTAILGDEWHWPTAEQIAQELLAFSFIPAATAIPQRRQQARLLERLEEQADHEGELSSDIREVFENEEPEPTETTVESLTGEVDGHEAVLAFTDGGFKLTWGNDQVDSAVEISGDTLEEAVAFAEKHFRFRRSSGELGADEIEKEEGVPDRVFEDIDDAEEAEFEVTEEEEADADTPPEVVFEADGITPVPGVDDLAFEIMDKVSGTIDGKVAHINVSRKGLLSLTYTKNGKRKTEKLGYTESGVTVEELAETLKDSHGFIRTSPRQKVWDEDGNEREPIYDENDWVVGVKPLKVDAAEAEAEPEVETREPNPEGGSSVEDIMSAAGVEGSSFTPDEANFGFKSAALEVEALNEAEPTPKDRKKQLKLYDALTQAMTRGTRDFQALLSEADSRGYGDEMREALRSYAEGVSQYREAQGFEVIDLMQEPKRETTREARELHALGISDPISLKNSTTVIRNKKGVIVAATSGEILHVHPDFQQMGLGSKLIDYLKDKGNIKMHAPDKAAAKFLSDRGFVHLVDLPDRGGSIMSFTDAKAPEVSQERVDEIMEEHDLTEESARVSAQAPEGERAYLTRDQVVEATSEEDLDFWEVAFDLELDEAHGYPFEQIASVLEAEGIEVPPPHYAGPNTQTADAEEDDGTWEADKPSEEDDTPDGPVDVVPTERRGPPAEQEPVDDSPPKKLGDTEGKKHEGSTSEGDDKSDKLKDILRDLNKLNGELGFGKGDNLGSGDKGSPSQGNRLDPEVAKKIIALSDRLVNDAGITDFNQFLDIFGQHMGEEVAPYLGAAWTAAYKKADKGVRETMTPPREARKVNILERRHGKREVGPTGGGREGVLDRGESRGDDVSEPVSGESEDPRDEDDRGVGRPDPLVDESEPSESGIDNRGGERDGGSRDPVAESEPVTPEARESEREAISEAQDRAERFRKLDRGRVSELARANSELIEYESVSKGNKNGLLMPGRLGREQHRALKKVEEKVGMPLDDWVSEKIGTDDATRFLYAEQVDAVAMAIRSIENGEGFIVGDQTGTGKGRIAASLVRYALEQGHVPVWFTQKKTLYKTSSRDLSDVEMSDLSMVATDNNLRMDLDAAFGQREMKQGEMKEALQAATERIRELTPLSADATKGQRKIHGKKLKSILGADVVVSAYTQVGPNESNRVRREFIAALAPHAILIMDESHLAAGGEGKGKTVKAKGQDFRLAKDHTKEHFRRFVGASRGGIFLSATWAKGAPSLGLYTNTPLGVYGSHIGHLVESGGLPLLQSVSSSLASNGSMIRRQRSMEGATFETVTLEGHAETSDSLADILSGVMGLDGEYRKKKKGLSAKFTQALVNIAEMHNSRPGSAAGMDYKTMTPYSSENEVKPAEPLGLANYLHPIMSSIMLSIKADQVADEAIKAIRGGMKPVIALQNTGDSVLEKHAETEGLKEGDEVGEFGVRQALMAQLHRSRTLTINSPVDPAEVADLSEKVGEIDIPEVIKRYDLYLTDEMLVRYNMVNFLSDWQEVEALINGADLEGISGSPLDQIIERLEAEGLRVGEATGREEMVRDGILRKRAHSAQLQGKLIARFNGDRVEADIDVLLINQSASTGLDMHAGNKFGDTSPRIMLIAQMFDDVNTLQQVLGRISRNDQAHPATYNFLISDIPVEKRYMSQTSKKLAKLNSTSTGEEGGEFDLSLDLTNHAGDIVTDAWLRANHDLKSRMGVKVSSSKDGTIEVESGIAKKVFLRMALLSVEDQESLINDLEETYLSLLEAQAAMGTVVTGAQQMDLNAKTISTEVLLPPMAEGATDHIAGATFLEKVEVDRLFIPATPSEIEKMYDPGVTKRTLGNLTAETDPRITELSGKLDSLQAGIDLKVESRIERSKKAHEKAVAMASKAGEAEPEYEVPGMLQSEIEALESARTAITDASGSISKMSLTLDNVIASRGYILLTRGEEVRYGRVLKVSDKKSSANPDSLSRYNFSIYTSEDILNVSGSALQSEFSASFDTNAKAMFEASLSSSKESREIRHIVTGNLIQAQLMFGSLGKVIEYTSVEKGEAGSSEKVAGSGVRSDWWKPYKGVSREWHLRGLPGAVFQSEQEALFFIQLGRTIERPPVDWDDESFGDDLIHGVDRGTYEALVNNTFMPAIEKAAINAVDSELWYVKWGRTTDESERLPDTPGEVFDSLGAAIDAVSRYYREGMLGFEGTATGERSILETPIPFNLSTGEKRWWIQSYNNRLFDSEEAAETFLRTNYLESGLPRLAYTGGPHDINKIGDKDVWYVRGFDFRFVSREAADWFLKSGKVEVGERDKRAGFLDVGNGHWSVLGLRSKEHFKSKEEGLLAAHRQILEDAQAGSLGAPESGSGKERVVLRSGRLLPKRLSSSNQVATDLLNAIIRTPASMQEAHKELVDGGVVSLAAQYSGASISISEDGSGRKQLSITTPNKAAYRNLLYRNLHILQSMPGMGEDRAEIVFIPGTKKGEKDIYTFKGATVDVDPSRPVRVVTGKIREWGNGGSLQTILEWLGSSDVGLDLRFMIPTESENSSHARRRGETDRNEGRVLGSPRMDVAPEVKSDRQIEKDTPIGLPGFGDEGAQPMGNTAAWYSLYGNLGKSKFSGKIKSRQELIDMLVNLYGERKVPIRTGVLSKGSWVGGYYSPGIHIIRIREAYDVTTAVHEVGHALQTLFSSDPGPFVPLGDMASSDRVLMEDELYAMGKRLYGTRFPEGGGYTSEGFAEFIREYMTRPEDAKRSAPLFYAWFTKRLKKEYPQLHANIQVFKQTLRERLLASPEQRATRDQTFEESKLDRVHILKQYIGNRSGVRADWLDNNAPLLQIDEHVRKQSVKDKDYRFINKSGILNPSASMYRTAAALEQSYAARTAVMSDRFTMDINGNPVGDPLSHVRKFVRHSEWKDFAIYLWARRALALANHPDYARENFAEKTRKSRKGGLHVDEALAIVNNLEANRVDRFQEAARRVYQWNNDILRYAASASPQLARVMHYIMKIDPGQYVPLWSVFDQMDKVVAASGGGAAQTATITKRLRGSMNVPQNVLVSMLANAENIVKLTHKRVVLDMLYKVRNVPDIGHLIEEIPADKDSMSTNVRAALDQISKALGVGEIGGVLIGEEGDQQDVQVTDADALLAVQFFFPTMETKENGVRFTMIEEGDDFQAGYGSKIKQFELKDATLLKTLIGVPPSESKNIILQFIQFHTRLWRMGTVAWRLSFGWITNPQRDFRTFWIQSRAQGNVAWTGEILKDLLAMMFTAPFYHAMSADSRKKLPQSMQDNFEWFDKWMALGGEMQTPVGQDINYNRRSASRTFQSPKQRIVDPSNWLDILAAIVQLPEGAVRVTELKHVAKARGLKPGDKMTADDAIVLNEAMSEVTVNFRRGGEKARQINRYVPFFTATINAYVDAAGSYKRNPQQFMVRSLVSVTIPAVASWFMFRDEEWYIETPANEKFQYNFIRVGDDIIRIRQPHEYGVAFGALITAMMDSAYREGDNSMDDFARFASSAMTPEYMPPILQEGAEQLANWDWFYDRPIVPRRAEGFYDADQFGPYTSRTAKFLGSTFGESPYRIDHAVRGFFGAAFTDAQRALESMVTMANRGREYEAADVPIIGATFRRGGATVTKSRSMDELYELKEHADMMMHSPSVDETEQQRQRRLLIGDATRAIGLLSAIRSSAYDIRDREKITLEMVDIAKEAVSGYKGDRYISGEKDFLRSRMRTIRKRAAIRKENAQL